MSSRQWVQKQIFCQRSQEKRGTVSNEASRERSILEGQYGWRRSEISYAQKVKDHLHTNS